MERVCKIDKKKEQRLYDECTSRAHIHIHTHVAIFCARITPYLVIKHTFLRTSIDLGVIVRKVKKKGGQKVKKSFCFFCPVLCYSSYHIFTKRCA